ncbi:MAG: hybrid sensor histidine kinase/response regulator [Symploca sp. SIO3C6]|nr:hybrid sensor histidine kinase/response regulator [Symploca sp. SIO3C6]
MNNNHKIHEQGLHYFLQEAPELLRVLEQDLLSLRKDCSLKKIHNLMRITHTLKGAAASVGLETIKSVAHSLEDIFKALCQPDLSIDSEVEALLFEGFECLRLPLTAQLTGGQVNDSEVLDRTAVVFAQLQDRLGDFFSHETHLPSSVELGFDVTHSIFEVGVTQRLKEIAEAQRHGDLPKLATNLRTQAEVFLGLAESLNLNGFKAIAQATIAALDNHPEQLETIARQALSDFLEGQAAVLSGDRDQGGEPSELLQKLSGLPSTITESVIKQHTQSFVPNSYSEKSQNLLVDTPESATPPEHNLVSNKTDSGLVVSNLGDSQLSVEVSAQFDENESENDSTVDSLLEAIWGESEESHSQDTSESLEIPVEGEEVLFIDSITNDSLSGEINQKSLLDSTSNQEQLTNDQSPISTPNYVYPPPAVRVNVEHLEQLNYSTGELLTNQNRQLLQSEQLKAEVKVLIERLDQHRQLLTQLHDLSESLLTLPERRFNRQWGMKQKYLSLSKRKIGERAGKIQSRKEAFSPLVVSESSPLSHQNSPFPEHSEHFDSLELQRYSEAQILIESILEDTVQLAEAADAIDLFATSSHQTLEKQSRLLNSSRDAIIEARMLPLGEIFGRFPRVLEQLEILHHKSVVLKLEGTEVLVEKLVAQKLYEPLLHLVRNAFDHGIESPEYRQQQGKPSQGQISICAYHRGSNLMIVVRDDGQGLNFEEIAQRAIERQLISHQQASTLDETQLKNLLFEPGFSTNSVVNDLSGRGMGLDVVRTQLQALNGSVTVDCEPDKGTTFLLQIPLSLTIAKLLLFQAGEHIYALLADTIEQILIPAPTQMQYWSEGKALRWGKGVDERLVPIYQLAKVLDYHSQAGEPLLSPKLQPFVNQEQSNPVLIVRSAEQLLGLEVDQLLGDQELVIRPLGAMIAPPKFVYGGSIMADGRLTLVLDGSVFMQYLFEQQTNTTSNHFAFNQPETRQHNYTAKTTYYTHAYRDVDNATPPRLSSAQQQQLPAVTNAQLPAVAQHVPQRFDKTILLVDDSITVRQTLAMTLKQSGYQVVQARDGYEAIEQIRHHRHIDLVICDIEMPRMNGFEFLKHRQQDPHLAEISVMMLTSRSGNKHRLLAKELGATDYITKPYLEHQFLLKVAEVLQNKCN